MKRWYKRCGADFIRGTMGLTLEEKGAYSLCLDLMYDQDGPIPDDARWLSGVCGVSIRKWTSLRNSLIKAGKLSVVDGCLINSRALFEIENAAKLARNQAETGAKGGAKRVENERAARENNDLGQATLKPNVREEKRREEKKEPPSPLEGEFDEFYKAYPRPGDRKAAERAYRTARKSATHAQIMQGLAGYVAEKHGEDAKYIKLPATWLNAGSWENQPPAKPVNPQHSDDLWETFLIGWGQGKPWPDTLRGPAPDRDGCLVPGRLLDRYRAKFGDLQPGHIKEHAA